MLWILKHLLDSQKYFVNIEIFCKDWNIFSAGGYIAPGDEAAAAGSYAAPSDEVPVYAEEELGGYAGDEAGDPALDMLLKSIPGVPGEDYPIYAEVPETAFACDGQVDGGEFEI